MDDTTYWAELTEVLEPINTPEEMNEVMRDAVALLGDDSMDRRKFIEMLKQLI